MRKVKFKVVRTDYGISCSVYAEGKYCLKFLKGTIARARKRTFGVAVFETRGQAEMFIKGYFLSANVKIIRVRPVGRGSTVNVISSSVTSTSLDYFYGRINKLYEVNTTNPPSGTIFYPAVEVLE